MAGLWTARLHAGRASVRARAWSPWWAVFILIRVAPWHRHPAGALALFVCTWAFHGAQGRHARSRGGGRPRAPRPPPPYCVVVFTSRDSCLSPCPAHVRHAWAAKMNWWSRDVTFTPELSWWGKQPVKETVAGRETLVYKMENLRVCSRCWRRAASCCLPALCCVSPSALSTYLIVAAPAFSPRRRHGWVLGAYACAVQGASACAVKGAFLSACRCAVTSPCVFAVGPCLCAGGDGQPCAAVPRAGRQDEGQANAFHAAGQGPRRGRGGRRWRGWGRRGRRRRRRGG
jgi:hypothetical protein